MASLILGKHFDQPFCPGISVTLAYAVRIYATYFRFVVRRRGSGKGWRGTLHGTGIWWIQTEYTVLIQEFPFPKHFNTDKITHFEAVTVAQRSVSRVSFPFVTATTWRIMSSSVPVRCERISSKTVLCLRLPQRGLHSRSVYFSWRSPNSSARCLWIVANRCLQNVTQYSRALLCKFHIGVLIILCKSRHCFLMS